MSLQCLCTDVALKSVIVCVFPVFVYRCASEVSNCMCLSSLCVQMCL